MPACTNLNGCLHLTTEGSYLSLGDLVSSCGVAVTPALAPHFAAATASAAAAAISTADTRHANAATARLG